MFCPKCGEQDRDDAKFCRTCGANLGLIAQVLSGRLPDGVGEDREKRARGVKYTVISVGLALIAVVVLPLAPAQQAWGIFFATTIAACIMLGVGLSELVSAGHAKRVVFPDETDSAKLSPKQSAGELSVAREPANMIPSATVTENTTRNLEAEVNDAREPSREKRGRADNG